MARGHRRFAAAASLLSLLVGLGACELLLRVRHARRLERLFAGVGHPPCVDAAPERELIYRLVRGRCGANARGFLDGEHALAKPAGVWRVVLIGDSVAEGSGVEADESFARVLERRLNETGARRYEVIKLARRGYSTRQELYLLEHEAFAYDPDLVVWSYVLNDPVDTRYHHGVNQMAELYRPRSYLWHLAATALYLRQERRAFARCDVEWRLALHCAHHDELTRELARAAELTRAHGVRVLFAIHPVLEKKPTFDDYPFAGVHRDLRHIAAAGGWTVVDLLDAYRSRSPMDLAQSVPDGWDDTHPNALGHTLAADALAREIERTR